MRAIIAAKFPAYTFSMLDQLDLDQVVELYASALWLGEQEAKSVKGTRKKRR